MTREDFEDVLKNKNLKKRCNHCKLKGFEIYFQYNLAIIKGKLPLELVESVYNKFPENKIFINYHFDSDITAYEVSKSEEIEEILNNNSNFDVNLISEIKKNTPHNQLYLEFIISHTTSGLEFIIDTIRNMPYINEWAIGNY